MSSREIKRVKPYKRDNPIYAEHTPRRRKLTSLVQKNLVWIVLAAIAITIAASLL